MCVCGRLQVHASFVETQRCLCDLNTRLLMRTHSSLKSLNAVPSFDAFKQKTLRAWTLMRALFPSRMPVYLWPGYSTPSAHAVCDISLFIIIIRHYYYLILWNRTNCEAPPDWCYSSYKRTVTLNKSQLYL